MLLASGLLTSCASGIFGKNTVAAVNKLDDNVVKSLAQLQDTVNKDVTSTRDEIFDFLRNHSEKEAHDISVGLLEGTIGYLDDPQNCDCLAQCLESLINHAGTAARSQLIQFKDELLDPIFIRQSRQFLNGIVQELLLHPTENLLNLALSDRTRNQLARMLRMLIPAVLNDSAIGQIGKLRNVLLGDNMKRDIASWVDTSLVVANYRLDSTLRPTIDRIVKDNGGVIRRYAGAIISGLIVLTIIIGLVVYWVKNRQVSQYQTMLNDVTLQIEGLRNSDPARYQQLTGDIQRSMLSKGLEGQLNRFLKDRHIS